MSGGASRSGGRCGPSRRPRWPRASRGAGELDDLVVLEGGEGLGDHGVGAAGEIDEGAEVVGQLGVSGLLRVGPARSRRSARRAPEKYQRARSKKWIGSSRIQLPTRLDVVPPAAGAGPVGPPPELDQRIERPADRAVVDHLLDLAPERREPELVTDGQDPAASRARAIRASQWPRSRAIGFSSSRCRPDSEHGAGGLGVQVRGQDDIDHVEVVRRPSISGVIGEDAPPSGGRGGPRRIADSEWAAMADQLGAARPRRWPGRGGCPRRHSRSGRSGRDAWAVSSRWWNRPAGRLRCLRSRRGAILWPLHSRVDSRRHRPGDPVDGRSTRDGIASD